MSEEERVDRLLEQKGIAPEDISYVILSHLHPDHIGGAAFFPKARFILTKTVFKTYQHAKLKDLIFKEFLPQDFESRLEVVEPQQVQAAFLYRKTVDLFGMAVYIWPQLMGMLLVKLVSFARLSSVYRS